MSYQHFNETNFTEKNAQEKYDYDKALMVFQLIYSASTGYTFDYMALPENSIPDMRYTIASGDTIIKAYVGEIKRRNKDKGELDEIELLVRKYTGLRRKRIEGEKIFYLSICNNSWWLFDLDELDLGQCRIDDWLIKDVQFSDCNSKSYYPTIFIPTKLAKIHGLCQQGIPTDICKDKNSIN